MLTEKTEYPTIFHIGLPKTGTTSIQYILGKDERINVIYNRYFNTTDWWTKEYSLFKKGLLNIVSEENQILQSDEFVKLSVTLSRISRISPTAKIILTIREQRALLVSRYRYEIPYTAGYYYSFEKWLKSTRGLDHLSASMYYSIYKTINAFFPKEQIKILFFEDLVNDYESFFTQFYNILELSTPSNLELNVIKNKSLSVSELLIMRNLNKIKLFRQDSEIAKKELFIFRILAFKFKNIFQKNNEFNWGENDFFKKIEEDFKYENNKLCNELKINNEFMDKFKYLV